MIEIRHKVGRFTIDEKEIMYLAFEDLQAMQEVKCKDRYCVSAVMKSGVDCVLYRSNDEYIARNAYDYIKATIEDNFSNSFVLPMTCEKYCLGVTYD